jgi:hypothetical protein
MNINKSPNGSSHKLIDLTKSILPVSLNTKYLNGSSPTNSNIKNNLRNNNNNNNHASQLNFITNTINNFMVNHGLLSPNNVNQEKTPQNGHINSNIKRLSSSPLSSNGVTSTSSPTRRSNRSSDVSSACESSTTTGRGSNSSRYSTSLSSSVSCDSSDSGTLSSNNSNTYITNSFSSSSMSSSSSSCSSNDDMTINKKRSLSNSFMNTSSENSTSSSFTSSTNSSRITRNSQKTSTTGSSSSATSMSVDQNVVRCLWTKCNFTSEDIDEKLIEHIKTKHILTQRSFHQFRCLWKDCNVYGNPSCSFNWLERHVIDHVDQKPFMCIFDECKRRFRTEALRERHVQSHINEPNSNNSNVTTNGFGYTQSTSLSPNKNRNNLLKTAKLALIENLKNKNSTSSFLLNDNLKNSQALPKSNSLSALNNKHNNNSAANLFPSSASIATNGNNSADTNSTSSILPNYSQILKTLTKKRKNLSNNDTTGRNKFKKAQYKDYIDPTSFKIIEKKLKNLNYESGKVTFNAKIISSRVDSSTKTQSFLVEWQPRNMYAFFSFSFKHF